MSLVVIGVNHNTAPVSIREKIAIDPELHSGILKSLINEEHIDEVMVVSTCNRTEFYSYCNHDSGDLLPSSIQKHFDINEKDLQSCLFRLYEDDAVQHILRVACGLDSMVLGEPQILGQLKAAYRIACETGAVGKMLNKLLQHSFSVAKQVRTDTAIGSSPVSVAFAAVRLAQQVFGDLNDKTALMIGAGDTIELAAQHLHENHLGHMVVANRTVERARILASRFNAYAIPLKELPYHLADADILISSTASQLPILGKGAVERALKQRKHKPIFMVDIAVPRDIEPEIGKLDDVYIYTVDDLQAVIEENQRSRRTAAIQADEIVLTETRHFMDWMQSLDAFSTIRAFRESLQNPQDELVSKARQRLKSGEDPEQIIEALARALTQKFTHMPSIRLKEASVDRQEQLISALKELFNL